MIHVIGEMISFLIEALVPEGLAYLFGWTGWLVINVLTLGRSDWEYDDPKSIALGAVTLTAVGAALIKLLWAPVT